VSTPTTEAQVEVPPAHLPPRTRVLVYMRRFHSTHGYFPSGKGMSRALGWGERTIAPHLRRLREEGLVLWEPAQHGTLRLTRSGDLEARKLDAAIRSEVNP
jgi:biotin operon repressor